MYRTLLHHIRLHHVALDRRYLYRIGRMGCHVHRMPKRSTGILYNNRVGRIRRYHQLERKGIIRIQTTRIEHIREPEVAALRGRLGMHRQRQQQ